MSISSDNKESQFKIITGSTVQAALKTAQITVGEMDRVNPQLNTVLTDGSQVKVIRVKEEYYTEQVVIPFVHQELKNEALPEGVSRLSQPGVNGLKEITYRRVMEDGVEVSNSEVNTIVLEKTVPEVLMIGSRSTFNPVNIPGRIAYISAGNAWLIETSTDNRKCIVSTGDLDGRIFSLSKNGKLLLFSRFSSKENTINSLWIAFLDSDPAKLIDLGVRNVVHSAEFDPGSNMVGYSTAEWRVTAPGWQANNDLIVLEIDENGFAGSSQLVLKSNAGGVYGWWGMEYFWAPDQLHFLYSRPDGIGIIDGLDETLTSILNITPYQSGGNWAWVPGVAWSPDGSVLYTVTHIYSGENNTPVSQKFDLIAIPLKGGTNMDLVQNVGMFAYPKTSPLHQKNNIITDTSGDTLEQNVFSVAFLQAIYPDQSETSGYRLFIMDRDGSNQKELFPEEGAIGLDPQQVVWSPNRIGTAGDYAIALIYNGNIWTVDVSSGVAKQITEDGLTNRIDWR